MRMRKRRTLVQPGQAALEALQQQGEIRLWTDVTGPTPVTGFEWTMDIRTTLTKT